jgi:hypothetical protein
MTTVVEALNLKKTYMLGKVSVSVCGVWDQRHLCTVISLASLATQTSRSLKIRIDQTLSLRLPL